jgi:hypothetical protein
MVEGCLGNQDAELHRHLLSLDVTSQVFAWLPLKTAFSELLTQDEWLIVWDNLLASHPALLIYMTTAYSVHNRSALLQCRDRAEVEKFYRHKNPIVVGKVRRPFFLLSPRGAYLIFLYMQLFSWSN